MNLFKLVWSWYEESSFWLFTHDAKTQQEFEADVKYLYANNMQGYLKQEQSWAGMQEYTAYVAKLLPALGYIEQEPISFGTFGGYIFSERDTDPEQVQLFGEGPWQNALEHNNLLNKEIHAHNDQD